MQKRCNRNRKRSKRRGICCPIHGCYLDSVSQKYHLYADHPGQLQARGINSLNARLMLAHKQAVPLSDDWLESFWCNSCNEAKWYRVRKCNHVYEVSLFSPQLWQQVTGVTLPDVNLSVSEFTQRQARMVSYRTCEDFI